jgi:hypothetical protein
VCTSCMASHGSTAAQCSHPNRVGDDFTELAAAAQLAASCVELHINVKRLEDDDLTRQLMPVSPTEVERHLSGERPLHPSPSTYASGPPMVRSVSRPKHDNPNTAEAGGARFEAAVASLVGTATTRRRLRDLVAEIDSLDQSGGATGDQQLTLVCIP